MTRDHAVENARNEMAKALRSLQEARSLASLELWDGAVSRAYYAAFREQADDGTSIRFDEDTGREEVDRATAFVDAMRVALAVDGIVVDPSPQSRPG